MYIVFVLFFYSKIYNFNFIFLLCCYIHIYINHLHLLMLQDKNHPLLIG